MNVAVIHEWLVVEAGAEKVLSAILEIFPDADLFCLVDFLPKEKRDFLGQKQSQTSFIQHLPGAGKNYRLYLPLMPLAVEQFDLSGYDLIISSSYAVAKGVITGPDQLHISYVHSPMRYAWDLQFQYLREAGLERGLKSWLVRWIMHKIRIWDCRTAAGVDHYIANSSFIARRIKKIYNRQAEVIHPPVDTDFFTPAPQKDQGNFYLTVSRLVPYKRIDLLIDTCRIMPDLQLIIIGDGPEREKLQKKARGLKIEFLGHCKREKIREQMRRARAFLFAAEEDFGIVPLEAQACGLPVIAYGKGGVTETINPPEKDDGLAATGIFFPKQEPGSIAAAIRQFEERENLFSAETCRANALKFATPLFQKKFKVFIENRLREFAATCSRPE